MEKERIAIAFVGHIDHGKSTTIGRILFDTKSLPENKQKEFEEKIKLNQADFSELTDQLIEERTEKKTIDTAQIFFKTKKKNYVIIDAPGHKEFLKNMLTGASQADAAVLIVSVLNGVEEQTKRHAIILSLLGIKNIVVAVNKMDAVNYNQKEFEKTRKQVLSFFKKTGLNALNIIPVSARKGSNIAKKTSEMKWYKGKTFVEELDSIQKNVFTEKNSRFAVQDVYTIKKQKIIVGKIESGKIKKLDTVFLFPENRKLKIKKIKVFGEKELKEAWKGMAPGLVLSDYRGVKRGSILCKGEKPLTARKFKAQILWFSEKPLKEKQELKLKLLTQEVKARISKIVSARNSSTLKKTGLKSVKATEIAEVIIETSKKIVFEKYSELPELGRFVLQEKNETIAAGIVR